MSGCNNDISFAQDPGVLDVNPLDLYFEPTRIGDTRTLQVTLSETAGDRPVDISVLSLSGPDRTAFALLTLEDFTLPEGGSRTLEIEFAPAATGALEATFSFTASNLHPEAEVPVVRLFGEALGPDKDGDGLSVEEGDCDDLDPNQSPGAPERCNGEDDDCDSMVDEDATDADTFFGDGDGDGYGAPGDTAAGCAPPAGYVSTQGDCDDGDATVYPGAEERCDGVDDDCDGSVDEDAVDAIPAYPDSDGDGYGSQEGATLGCALPPGAVALGGDCDDGDGGVYPGAPERCDGADEDCDGAVDEGALDAAEYWPDGDGDGYGAGLSPTLACDEPPYAAPAPGDCNDANAGIHPGAEERCDGVDSDCDGTVDEDAVDALAYFADGDGDGHGDPATLGAACDLPEGVGLSGGDCDDTDPGVNPDAPELCNGRDDDCNGLIDDDPVGVGTWYVDADGDDYGGAETIDSCEGPEGYVLRPGDCDDTQEDIHPGADERCDEQDGDCDGQIDEDPIDPVPYWDDGDGDGFGDPESAAAACTPEGVLLGGDCDDGDGAIYPGAEERCDGRDADCDGIVDEDAVDAPIYYVDGDGDTYGADALAACIRPAGTATLGGDCDDADPSVFPAAVEVCNGKDDDCDGVVDLDVENPGIHYYDADEDGVGGPTQVEACTAPEGYVPTPGDCDDGDGSIHPGHSESCDGQDEDCDGQIDEEAIDPVLSYQDGDGDGFGDPALEIEACAPQGPTQAGDCDDGDADIYPGATELCDGLDGDCDGLIDEDAQDPRTYHPDLDDDDVGGSGPALEACTPPEGYVATEGDCDDGDASIYPGAPETCDGDDDDCDGSIDERPVDGIPVYPDLDGDGYGEGASTPACAPPTGYSATPGDCDDGADHIYPGADEYCDDADGDCDGVVDEDAVDATTWGQDGDGDGYGGGPFVTQCDPPDGGSVPVDGAHPEDCDDTDGEINPGATDLCDGEDRNCDGAWSRAECEGCHVEVGGAGALYPNIQAALNDAAPPLSLDFGGEIRVCAGTYNETLRFKGAPIMLRGVGAVIVRPTTCTSTVQICSAVSFRDGEGAASGLSNLTLKDGRGTQSKVIYGGTSTERLGGGVLIDGASPTLEGIFIEGAVADKGAGIYLKGGAATLAAVEIDGAEGVRGAGIYADGASLTVTQSQLIQGHANFEGAGIYLVNASLSLTESDLTENLANGVGGGIYALDSTLTLTDVSFIDNRSTASAGGGLYQDGGSLFVERGFFQENDVQGGSTDQGGGALHARDVGQVTLVESIFIGNDSGGSGGALSVVGAEGLTATDCQLRYNNAQDSGGGAYLKGVLDLQLTAPIVRGNTARYGAGIFAQGSAGELLHGAFVENLAREFGGGAKLESGSVDVTNSAFLSNTARQGGGLHVMGMTSDVTNNTFVDNNATEVQYGGALEVQTLGAGMKVRNNILVYGLGYMVHGPGTLAGAFKYNDVHSGTGKDVIGFMLDTTTNLTADPLLYDVVNGEDPLSWDLAYPSWSPCADAGDPAVSERDPDATRNDMGIYGGPTAQLP